MSRIYIPANSAEQWASLLADPVKHWRQGYSARALAHCWQQADGFPSEVRDIFTPLPAFADLEFLLGIPEHKVTLPGGSRPSQNDLWVLARGGGDLVSIAVEGKVDESFGPLLDEWRAEASPGKGVRLEFLCRTLSLAQTPSDAIRYQLLHRAAAAVLEAKRFNATRAVMLVHSFSQGDACFADFADFLKLFDQPARKNELISAASCTGIALHFAWVRGDPRFLLV